MFGHTKYLVLAAGGVLSAGIYAYPHTLGLEDYKNKIRAHANGEPENIKMEVYGTAEQILHNFKWKNSKEIIITKKIDFVPSNVLDFTHKGCMATKWGAVVGIPHFRSHGSTREDFSQLFNQHKINPSSKAALELEKTFTLSSNAQNFALAREIQLVSSYKLYFSTVATAVGIGSLYVIPKIVSEFSAAPKALVIFVIFPLLLLGYKEIIKKTNCYTDRKVDKAVASLSLEMAQGGLEFYSAQAKREEILESISKVNESVEPLSTSFLLSLVDKWAKTGLTPSERLVVLKKIVEQNSSSNALS